MFGRKKTTHPCDQPGTEPCAVFNNLHNRCKQLEDACSKMNGEVCEILGRALGYPWLKDDQKNFPGATEADGVCVGDHVAESIASEAAERIVAQAYKIMILEAELKKARQR